MNAGKNIAHYKIIRALGQGDMGEVYLTEDTKLDRQVAIKVLPESHRSDPERRQKKTTLASRFDLISLRFVKNLANCYVQPSIAEGKGSRCYYGNAYNKEQGTHLTACSAHIPLIIYKGVHK